MTEGQPGKSPRTAAERPSLPASYGVDPARVDDMLAWSQALAGLTAARNYWVTTVDRDSLPHATPVWGVVLDGMLHFATDPQSRKARNLRQRSSILVHLESGDDVLIIEGIAEVVREPATRDRFATHYDAKYALRPDISEDGALVIRLTPTRAFAWQEADFPATATRWRFPLDDGAHE